MRQLWVLVMLFAGGCIANMPLPLVEVPPPKTDPPGPVLIHVPGTSGDTIFDKNWTDALVDAGLKVSVEHFEWTRPDKRHIAALHAVDENRHDARRLADRITQLYRENPHRRIILTSQSGGPMIAAFALEQLPADVYVDTWVMLNPAVSPMYNLSAALTHVRDNAYVFISDQDWLYNGLGTGLVGLMDGPKGAGAGQVGFTRPDTGDPEQYSKLVQIEHRWAWVKYGNFGHHTGALTPWMARNIISPLLQTGMLPG